VNHLVNFSVTCRLGFKNKNLLSQAHNQGACLSSSSVQTYRQRDSSLENPNPVFAVFTLLTAVIKLVSNIASRRWLRSAQRRHLDVPRYNRSTLGRRSFSDAGPTVWNLLPDDLRDQGCTESTFKQSLKTYLFAQH